MIFYIYIPKFEEKFSSSLIHLDKKDTTTFEVPVLDNQENALLVEASLFSWICSFQDIMDLKGASENPHIDVKEAKE
jgi:hypothetical protein